MSDLTNKDAEQDTKLAVLESTVDNSVRRIEMVHKRVDGTNETLEELRQRILSWRCGLQVLLLLFQQQLLSSVLLLQRMLNLDAPLWRSSTGEPCATHEVSVAVQEVSIKPEEKE